LSKWLHGLHDAGGEHLMSNAPGWIVHTVQVKDERRGDFSGFASRGFSNIVRLNWAHNGVDGTIPLPGQYDEFAKLCAEYVKHSPGIHTVIIGNEPNHSTEWPQRTKIMPEAYADCFNRCYDAIKRVNPNIPVGVAALSPWNNEAGMDWLNGYWIRMLWAIKQCDAIAVHGYTHGVNPQLIWSMETHPNGWFWHFPVIYQTIEAIPDKFKDKPVHVTEIDQNEAWLDRDTGWVEDAYKSANQYNQRQGVQRITSLSVYRWKNQQGGGDKWGIQAKAGVQEDFRAAAGLAFLSQQGRQGVKPPVQPPVVQPPNKPVEPKRSYFDPALIARGVNFVTPSLRDGEEYWCADHLEWLDLQESGGRHHIYGNVYGSAGQELFGVNLRVDWSTGKEDVKTAKDQVSPYSYNYPMSGSLNDYDIRVLGGTVKSEMVTGIGMGLNGNPKEHTSTVVKWKLKKHESATVPPVVTPPVVTPPIVTPPTGALLLVLPCNGVITQRFGENPADYAKFNQPGHNGTDIANAAGTPIVAIADGEVMFTGFDPGSDPKVGGYGYYVRIYHPALRFHSFYAHIKEGGTLVKAGDKVKQGQHIALMGSTGNSSGNHLHLEIRLGTREQYAPGQYGYSSGRVDPQVPYYFFGNGKL
jgi:murein DD-endopeptidase MepM/ murein hydrolase activator NlpD